MGAQSFIEKGKGKSVGDVFNEIVENYEYEYGHNAYNGTMSTCSLGRNRTPLSLKPNYCKENEEKAYKFIDDHDNGDKWVADYIDLGKTEDGEHIFMFYGWASC